MRSRFFLFLLFVLTVFQHISFAQNKTIDSLTRIITSTKVDTDKIKTLNLLSRQYYLAGNYAKALKEAELALSLSNKLPYKNKAIIFGARAHNHIGNIYYSEGNLTGALQHYLEALSKMEMLSDKKAMAVSYHNIGNVYLSQENAIKAMEFYRKSLKLKRVLGDLKGIANSLNSIGNVYASQDRFEEGIKSNLEALILQQSISDKRGTANSYNNMGAIYKELNKLDASLKNYLAALKIYEETDNAESIALVTSNIGGIYYRQKNYKMAEAYLNKGLRMSKEIGALEQTKDALKVLSEVCSNNEKHLLALKYYKE